MKPTKFEVELALEVVKPESVERAERAEREGKNYWLWNSDPNKVPGKKEQPS